MNEGINERNCDGVSGKEDAQQRLV